jgi:hypothetical protein
MKKTLLYAGAAVIAAGIIPLDTANATGGPCGEPVQNPASPGYLPWEQCMQNQIDQGSRPAPPDSNPAQNICNLTGACTAPGG